MKETSPLAKQIKTLAAQNFQEAVQIPPEKFCPMYREKKPKCQPLRLQIPEEDEAMLDLRPYACHRRRDSNRRTRYVMPSSKIARIHKWRLLYQCRNRCDVYLRLCQPVEPCAPQQDKTAAIANRPESASGFTSLFAPLSPSKSPGTYNPEGEFPTSSKEKGAEGASVVDTFWPAWDCDICLSGPKDARRMATFRTPNLDYLSSWKSKQAG